jgi:hypothetical protein
MVVVAVVVDETADMTLEIEDVSATVVREVGEQPAGMIAGMVVVMRRVVIIVEGPVVTVTRSPTPNGSIIVGCSNTLL